MRPLSDTRVRILRRLARNLTEVQHRALAWIVGAGGSRRPWCLTVDARTQAALLHKGLIVEAPGRVDATDLGRSVLAAAGAVRG